MTAEWAQPPVCTVRQESRVASGMTHFPAFGWPLSLSDLDTIAGGTKGRMTADVINPMATACCERPVGLGARAEKCLIVAEAALTWCAANILDRVKQSSLE